MPEPAVTAHRVPRPGHETSTRAARHATAGASDLECAHARDELDIREHLDPSVVAAWHERECERQSLPPTITNRQTLRTIATLAFSGLDNATSRRPASSPTQPRSQTAHRSRSSVGADESESTR